MGFFSFLRSAKRAEPPTHSNFRDDTHEFPNVQAVGFKKTDGVWWCCGHGHINEVEHWTKRHPFPDDSLVCHGRVCGHVVCENCTTTEILNIRKVDSGNPFETIDPHPSGESRFGLICPCGKSHRIKTRAVCWADAILPNIICSCGRNNPSDWLRFTIGSNQDWRLRSDECTMKAKLAHIDRQIAKNSRARREERRAGYTAPNGNENRKAKAHIRTRQDSGMG